MKKLFLLLVAVLAMGIAASAQTRTVQGTVVFAGDGEPLIGVSVIPAGEQRGVATDIDGKFSIAVPQQVKKLTFSYVGMISQEVEIPADGKMEVRLNNKENVLDEVMVVAYGTATRATFTGSAATVSADQIEDRLVSNVTKALAGSVAGVQTMSSNGQPGTSATVRIRGVGSINASMNPLYVVDGVPFDGDISSISPSDIESLTVLKDAAAAALYGARGANGVILITTKRGNLGKAKVTVDMRWGANSREIPNYDVIKSPEQWYEINYQAQRGAALYELGYSPAEAHAYANSLMFKSVGYNVYTVPAGEGLINPDGRFNPNATMGWTDGTYYFRPDDWEKYMFRNGFRQEYTVGISGASDRYNYYVSGSFLDDKGVIEASSYKRFTARTSLEYKVNDWLKVGTNLSYAYSDSNYPAEQTSTTSSGNAFFLGLSIAPVYPIFVRNADGTIYQNERDGRPVYDYGDGMTGYTRQFMSMSNPLSDLIYNYEAYLMDYFSGKWFAQINPLEGLTITGTASINIDNTRFHLANNPYYGQSANYGGEAVQALERTKGLNLQALANYKKTIGPNNFDILAGYESYDYSYEEIVAYGNHVYQPGNWTVDNTLNGAQRTGSGMYVDYATRGILARINYDYDSRYFASVSFRRDGSSCFHPDHRWGNFYSVSGAWELANEPFMEGQDWVDMLKVKASFGQQGNDNLGRGSSYAYYYPYVDQYKITGSTSWSDGTLYFKGNPDITWEKSNSFNVGVDFDMFKSMINGGIEFFSRQTSDMLYNKPVASSNGYTSIPMNIGSMRNSGVEIDINYTPVNTRDITWTINGNATFLSNKIIKLAPELDGELISGSRIYREGESMYAYYLTPYAGVDPASGQALFWARKPQLDANGEQEMDANGNPLWTDEEYATTNRTAAYNSNRKSYSLLPKVYGGFGTTLKLYGFDISAQFSYQLGGKIWDGGYQNLMGSGTSASYGHNWHVDILNAWTPENPYTDVPRLNASDAYSFYSYSSDRVLVSSNYLALNNITIGYTLPTNVTKKFGVESLRFYGVADNVAVWSARKGLDPRQSYTAAESATYSALRCISGGVKVVF